MNQTSKTISLWGILLFLLLIFWSAFENTAGQPGVIKYSDFRQSLDEGKVSRVTISDNEIVGEYKDGFSESADNRFVTYPIHGDESLVDALRANKVEFDSKPELSEPWYMTLLINWFPMLLLIGVWIFFMRQIQAGGGKAMNFGKSRARLLEEGPNQVTFEDVAGVEESKEELDAIVQFLKDPKKFTKLGGRIPKGVLLVGNPGTGKTLLARAIAGEAGVPFFSISGSDFVEMFVGVGASRVRDLFMRGKKNAPCIIFIDEIDAVGRHRGAGLGGGHDEREQTLNQLLVEMDGFEANEGVILIAATNRPDVLDPALLRPGRFDRQVVVPLPDIRGRSRILGVHTRKVPVADDVDLDVLARGTPGFSGAELANLVNEAALYAALLDDETVTMRHFEYAKDKIMMGAERRSMILNDDEKKVTAYHEAGHAIVAKLIPDAEPVHKVTIVPRGRALGLMQQLPADEKHNFQKQYWLNRICIAFGGRAAEEIAFNEITTGAESDISVATGIARKMVCEWGMSEELGPLAYGKKDSNVFLGKDISEQRDYSEETANQIDREVREIVESQLERSRKLLNDNRSKLDALAEALLAKETLDAEEVEEIVNGTSGPVGGGGGGGKPADTELADGETFSGAVGPLKEVLT